MNRFFALVFILLSPVYILSQDLYSDSTISLIELTFEESNWDYLLDSYYAQGDDQKLIGKAVVNGVQFDSVGVKYKGNSTYSANNAKNPLHIYLDHVINQDYDGYESIKLSNGKKDPSFVREVLSYEIARKYMKAPQSNYAKVYINGNYYGMFSSSEAIDSEFIDRRIFSDKDNVRIKCNPSNTSNGGSSLEYLGSDTSLYYSYYEVKSDYGWEDLMLFTSALVNDPDNIEEALNIDQAIWMLAFNNVLVNLDSYSGPFRQNYYLIENDNGKFVPVTWDLNESLGAFSMIDQGGSSGGRPGPPSSGGGSSDLQQLDLFLRSGDATYPLIDLILSSERYGKMYVAHCRTMLDENFVTGWYLSRANELQSLISSDLGQDPNAFYSSYQFTSNLSSTQDGVIGISELMASRITYLQDLPAFNYSQPVISNIIQPAEAVPYTTIELTAEISDASYAYLAYRHSKDEAFRKVEMLDDGLHNDGAASDGIFGVSFDLDESNTHYYIYAENSEAGVFSPARAEQEYYKIGAEASMEISDEVVVNELMASNSNTTQDNYGDWDDWVELFNNTSSDISLSGYYLTDDEEDIMKWPFPDTVINANDYLIIWTDGDEEQEGLHASFKLSKSGESLFLVSPDLVIVNGTEFGSQLEDFGFARNPNGYGDFVIQGPTFAFDNEETEIPNDDVDLTGMDEPGEEEILLYPVPVSSRLFVSFNSQVTTISTCQVLNLFGQRLHLETYYGMDQLELDVSQLPSGIYFLVLETGSGVTTRKFLKE